MYVRWLFALSVSFAVFSGCSDDSGADNPRPANGAGGDAGVTTTDERRDAASTEDGAVASSDGGPDATAPVGALFAFVGSNDGKIRSYNVDAATGAFTLAKESNAGTSPSFLAFDPPRRRVVAVDEIGGAGMVRSFAFDPVGGGLSEVSSKPAGGAASTHVSFDPEGKWMFVANYTGGNMSVFPIDGAGMIGAPSDAKVSGVKSHWAGTNPSGTHVFVPALGANVVAQYVLNKATGRLTDNGAASLPANAGPRHLAFHPNESWGYVINETAITVTTFDFNKGTGKLTAKQTISALPPGQNTTGVSGAEIFVHPSGKHVYASTRGFNSIVQLSVGADGTLTRVANAPTGGDRPRSFGMDPEGTLLFAGNQALNHVVGFRIGATGVLTPLGKIIDVNTPTFVGLTRMP